MFLIGAIILYVLFIFFYEKLRSAIFYDIWLDISELLNQSNYSYKYHTDEECDLFSNIESLSNSKRAPTSLRETLSRIKVLSFITRS